MGCTGALGLFRHLGPLAALAVSTPSDVSAALPAHNHLEDKGLCVALIPGWASE